MVKNLVPVRNFFKTQNNPKAKAMVDALADLTSVTADLEGYVNSLAPAATFLQHYSDFKPSDAAPGRGLYLRRRRVVQRS
jgi:hypothetical protein